MDDDARAGTLIAVEGLNGVGKSYLTRCALSSLPPADRPVLIEEFSQRLAHHRDDLGRALLWALVDASNGEPFLRGGAPATETLLLLAIKMHDYEAYCAPALNRGRSVIEGRGVHTTAVYQSLILYPDNDAHAHASARAILTLAEAWRPLPDLTILIVDDVTTAIRRAEHRDAISHTPEQWRMHHRAAEVYAQLAADDPARIQVIDRCGSTPEDTVRLLATLISTTHDPGRVSPRDQVTPTERP
ncbi:MAG: thymidylate kinase [Actinobacteria bacterium]|nr:thymidylate kinase [Actinomycetota bacterium]MBI3686013.1 thymidylate kinase [Actinomycetota bacterium]